MERKNRLRPHRKTEPDVEPEAMVVNYSTVTKSRYVGNRRSGYYSDTDSGEFASAYTIIPTVVELHEIKSTQERGNHSTPHAATGDSHTIHSNNRHCETSAGASGGGDCTYSGGATSGGEASGGIGCTGGNSTGGGGNSSGGDC